MKGFNVSLINIFPFCASCVKILLKLRLFAFIYVKIRFVKKKCAIVNNSINFAMMIKIASHTKKILVASICLIAMQVVLASTVLTGIVDEQAKAKKYSLSNLHHLSRKNISLFNLKSGLLYRGSQIFSDKSTKNNNNTSEFISILQFERGNTTYIMPYKMKIKVPKFKTPTPFNN